MTDNHGACLTAPGSIGCADEAPLGLRPSGNDPSRELISHGLNALAERCEKAPHMSRDLDADLKIVERALFSQNYTGSLDAATRLIPDGFVWCAGTAYSDDDDKIYSWANVRTLDPYSRIDFSTRGATTALALCSAALRCRAAQAIEARSGETGTGSIGEADESAVAKPCAQGEVS